MKTSKVVLPLLLVASAVWADAFKDSLEDASECVEKAQERLDQPRAAACRSAIHKNLKRAREQIENLGKNASFDQVMASKAYVAAILSASAQANCSMSVSKKLARAVAQLEAAAAVVDDESWRRRRDDRHSDRDDDDWGPGPGPGMGNPEVSFANPRIVSNEMFEGEAAVRVDVAQVSLKRMAGHSFYIGVKFRPATGEWSDWLFGQQQYPVNGDPYTWNSTQTFYLRHRTLRAADGNGKFIAHVGIFDASGAEIGSREFPFEVRFGPTTVGPPPPPGGPGPGPGPMPSMRDCGTGQDVGCTLARNGLWAMDRIVFEGLTSSMRANVSELSRLDIVKSMLAGHGITAKQLGVLLDLFNSDLNKLDLARAAATKVVNPSHAVGLSAKFRSSLNQTEFVQLMAGQH